MCTKTSLTDYKKSTKTTKNWTELKPVNLLCIKTKCIMLVQWMMQCMADLTQDMPTQIICCAYNCYIDAVNLVS